MKFSVHVEKKICLDIRSMQNLLLVSVMDDAVEDMCHVNLSDVGD